jgi:hypothetical protein
MVEAAGHTLTDITSTEAFLSSNNIQFHVCYYLKLISILDHQT